MVRAGSGAPVMANEEYLTFAEAAEVADVAVSTIYYWVRQKWITPYGRGKGARVGARLIKRSELLDFLAIRPLHDPAQESGEPPEPDGH